MQYNYNYDYNKTNRMELWVIPNLFSIFSSNIYTMEYAFFIIS